MAKEILIHIQILIQILIHGKAGKYYQALLHLTQRLKMIKVANMQTRIPSFGLVRSHKGLVKLATNPYKNIGIYTPSYEKNKYHWSINEPLSHSFFPTLSNLLIKQQERRKKKSKQDKKRSAVKNEHSFYTHGTADHYISFKGSTYQNCSQ